MNLQELLGENYKEDMSVDEINAALAEVEFPDDNSSELQKLKAALSKSNSEAASYKKQLREKQTEDEIKEQKQKEEQAELKAKYDELLFKTTVSENKANLLAMGYDEALANETAEAMAKGESDKVFANHQKHLKSFEKKIRAEALQNTPKPTKDNQGEDGMTLEKLKSMTPNERYQYSVENPDKYKELYGG